MTARAKAKYLFLFIFINALTYFGIQFFITSSKYNLLMPLDDSIPFMPNFIWIYHTLIPVIFIALIALMKTKELFLSAITACLLAVFILSIFYVFLPSFYPRDNYQTPDTVAGVLLKITRKLDGAHNTFPSGHVTYSWLMAFFVGLTACARKNRWIYLTFLAWALAISISTLTLKQHYVIDVVSGLALASLCYFLSKAFIFDRLSNST